MDSQNDARGCHGNCRGKCAKSCPCSCTCHVPCTSNCETPVKTRNLVVSIDGTSNQFGPFNTNVVELHSQIIKDSPDTPQLTYYNSGIGTFAPPSLYSPAYWKQSISNKIDLAIAWKFAKIIRHAYRWLVDHYQPGDKIYLFGFSRGAYQVRSLAGMIEKVGLLFAGNQEQIPFAYELYANKFKGKAHGDTDKLAAHFKKTFSRPSVKVHFLGAWDTVSSIGMMRGRLLPLTDACDHICFFRHALALDERRVKFLPEYVLGGAMTENNAEEHAPANDPIHQGDFASQQIRRPQRCKEVWFAGSHSDIGGGIRENLSLNLASMPLTWMEGEAIAAGLLLHSRPFDKCWNVETFRRDVIDNSLSWWWWPFEVLPIKRLTYTNKEDVTRRPHRGKGRTIVSGQRIHISVAFKEGGYTPHAQGCGIQLNRLVNSGEMEDSLWTEEWKDCLETNLFNTPPILSPLQAENAPIDDIKKSLVNLLFIAFYIEGAQAIERANGIGTISEMLGKDDEYVQETCYKCLCQLAKYYGRHVAIEIGKRRHVSYLISMLVREQKIGLKSFVEGLMFCHEEIAEHKFDKSFGRYIPRFIEMLKDGSALTPEHTDKILQPFAEHKDLHEAFGEVIPQLIEIPKEGSALTSEHAVKILQALAHHEVLHETFGEVILRLIEVPKEGSPLVLEHNVKILQALAHHKVLHEAFGEVIRRLIEMPKGESALMLEHNVKILQALAGHEELHEAFNQAIPQLVETLKDGRALASEHTIKILRLFAQHKEFHETFNQAIPRLVETSKDGSELTSEHAIKVLRSLAQHEEFHKAFRQVIPRLIEMLKGGDVPTRELAFTTLQTLARHKEFHEAFNQAIPRLVEALKDGSVLTSEHTIEILRSLAQHEEFHEAFSQVIPRLIETLKGGSTATRELAFTTLRTLAQHKEFREAFSRAVPRLVEMLKGGSVPTSEPTVKILLTLAQHEEFDKAFIRVIPQLIEMLKDGSSPTSEHTIKILQTLAQHKKLRKTFILYFTQLIEVPNEV